jgi:hypothetical protein
VSPKQRYQAPKVRERAEILKAVGAAAAVVVGTAILVWMLRPGPSDRFDDGGGGILSRQPRVGWLVTLTILALGGFVWWVFTRPRRQRQRLLAIGCVMILVVAVLAGFFWPGGLLRQYQTIPEFDPTDFEDLSTTVPAVTETTVPGATDSTAVTDTSAGTTDTTAVAPDSTTPQTTTDTTGSP